MTFLLYLFFPPEEANAEGAVVGRLLRGSMGAMPLVCGTSCTAGFSDARDAILEFAVALAFVV